MGVNDLVATVTVATGFATSTQAPQFIRIDNEYMIIHPSYVSGVSVPVYRRGDQGSAVFAHNAGATVVTGLFTDMIALQAGADAPVTIPTEIEDIVTYSVAGPIALPVKNTTVQLNNSASALPMTILAPTLDMDGITMTIVGLTARANTVTGINAAGNNTAMFLSGQSGSPHTIWTATTGFKGQNFSIQASQGSWIVLSNQGGTFS